MIDYECKIDLPAAIRTSGRGLWSRENRMVDITGFELHSTDYEDEEDDEDQRGFQFGELRVYFTTRSWNTKKHGLIYTDPEFLRHLCMWMSNLGLAGDDVGYSEQGMQGIDYVSCDVGAKFIQSFFEKYDD